MNQIQSFIQKGTQTVGGGGGVAKVFWWWVVGVREAGSSVSLSRDWVGFPRRRPPEEPSWTCDHMPICFDYRPF